MLMRRELAVGAAELGVGCRRGERPYALKAMMEQDGAATSSGSGSGCVLGWPTRHGLRRHGNRPMVVAPGTRQFRGAHDDGRGGLVKTRQPFADALRDAIGQVLDPELHLSVVELEMIRDGRDGRRGQVTVERPHHSRYPMTDRIGASVASAAAGLVS